MPASCILSQLSLEGPLCPQTYLKKQTDDLPTAFRSEVEVMHDRHSAQHLVGRALLEAAGLGRHDEVCKRGFGMKMTIKLGSKN